MKLSIKKLIIFLVLIALFVGAYMAVKSNLKDKYVTHTISQNSKIPDFTLLNVNYKEVNLYNELKKGPVVLSFYRGGWCPICNIQLRHYQQNLDRIEAFGAQLIAVSPELPVNAQLTTLRHHLKFEVLHDKNNNVARKLGLLWTMPERSRENFVSWLKKTTGKTLKDFNGQKDFKLPVPATLVIDQNGIVDYAFIDINYRNRADLEDILESLKNITGYGR